MRVNTAATIVLGVALGVFLAARPANAQPEPIGLWSAFVHDIRPGIRYYYLAPHRWSYPVSSSGGITTYQSVTLPLGTHIVTIDRRHSEYELRVLGDQIDPRTCTRDQLMYRTRSVEFFATTHRPAAIVAINGCLWGPSTSPGRAEQEQVFPVSTLVTNFDIRHMRANSWAERRRSERCRTLLRARREMGSRACGDGEHARQPGGHLAARVVPIPTPAYR